MLAKDEDNDSNERDPFTDRSFNFFDLEQDWGPSDRDIRHKVNFFGYFTMPGGFWANTRVQYRSAQPITRQPAQPERRRPRPQQQPQGQRVLHLRLAAGAAVPLRRAATS